MTMNNNNNNKKVDKMIILIKTKISFATRKTIIIQIVNY